MNMALAMNGRPFEFVEGDKVFVPCFLNVRVKNSFGHSNILSVLKEAISMQKTRIQSLLFQIA